MNDDISKFLKRIMLKLKTGIMAFSKNKVNEVAFDGNAVAKTEEFYITDSFILLEGTPWFIWNEPDELKNFLLKLLDFLRLQLKPEKVCEKHLRNKKEKRQTKMVK